MPKLISHKRQKKHKIIFVLLVPFVAILKTDHHGVRFVPTTSR
jgi:hypothetical protein